MVFNRDMNTDAEIKRCKCGCRAVMTTKANFKPGHDAKYVGIQALAIATCWERGENAAANLLTNEILSDKLRAKVLARAAKLARQMEDEVNARVHAAQLVTQP